MSQTIILTGVFTARYRGRCALDTCERGGVIEQGSTAQYADAELYHLACARRVERGDTAPLCKDCYLYHVGEC